MDQHKIHNSTTLIKSYKLVSLFATKIFTETVVRLVNNHLIYTGEKMLIFLQFKMIFFNK